MAAKRERDKQHTPPVGYIAHSCAARTRFVLPELKGKVEPLTALCDSMLGIAGVREVEARLLTGSLIVHHDGTTEELARRMASAPFIEIRAEGVEHGPATEAKAWQEQIDGLLEEFFGKGVDIKGVAAFALFAIALRQIAAGKMLPPATTALWYGVSLLMFGRKNQTPPIHGSDA